MATNPDQLILDQNVIGQLHSPVDGRYIHQNMDRWIRSGQIPSRGLVTLFGIVEFLGFNFRAKPLLASLDVVRLKAGGVAKKVIESPDLFEGRLNGNVIKFGVVDFLSKASERLQERKKFSDDAPIRWIYASIEQFLTTLTTFPDWLSNYFAVKAIVSAVNLKSFGKDSDRIAIDTIKFGIENKIPCTRAALTFVNLKKGTSKQRLKDGAEFFDEDAVWYLVFGKNESKITFVTFEKKFEHLVAQLMHLVNEIDKVPELSVLSSLALRPGQLIVIEKNNIGLVGASKFDVSSLQAVHA